MDGISVWAKFAYTASDGKEYNVGFYNLDVIIYVGYRVKSHRGTKLSCKINYNDALVGKKDYYSSALLQFSISERLRENWLNQGNYEMYALQYRQIADITQKVLVFRYSVSV